MGRLSNGSYAGSTVTRLGALGGGGWVMSVQIAPNGHQFATVDTISAYHKAPGEDWKIMVTLDRSLADGATGEFAGDTNDCGPGTWGLGFCPAEPSTGYIVQFGRPYRFVDYAQTAGSLTLLTGFTPEHMNANMGPMRPDLPTLACHPTNASIMAFTAPSGLYYSTNGTSVTKSTSFPAAPTISGQFPVHMVLAVDPTNANHWVAMVPSVGVYQTTTGPNGAWSLMSGSPTTPKRVQFAPDGTLYALSSYTGNGGLFRYSGGSWSADLWPDCTGLVFDPANPTRLWANNSVGQLRFSTNQATTLTSYAGRTFAATDIPYLAATNDSGATGNMAWDPVRNCIVWGCGIGVWETVPATSNVASATLAWTGATKGIAQLCMDDLRVVHAPGTASDGDFISAVQDRGFFVRSRDQADIEPAGHGPNYNTVLTHGANIDYAPNAAHYRVATSFGGLTDAGQQRSVWVSSNRGLPGTWQGTPQPLPLNSYSGAVACGGVGRILVAPIIPGPGDGGSDTKRCMITTDGGATWDFANIAGGRDLGSLYYAYTARSQRICHDPFEPGRYLIVPNGVEADTADNLAAIGVWDLKDDGSPAVRTRTNRFEGWVYDYWNVRVRANPLRQHHFGYTCGSVGGGGNPAPTKLWLTRDRFATAKALPGFGEIYDFDYGAAGVGEGYERLFLIGFRDDGTFGVFVVWNLDLDAATPTYQWAKIDRYPQGWIDGMNRIAADKGKFNRFYVGRAGSGVSTGDYRAPFKLKAA